MKLLNDKKTELAVLNESTTKLLYWGTYPVILYYSSVTDHGETKSRLATITKIEALDGYIETDAGNLIKLEGSVGDKISTLESLIGTKNAQPWYGQLMTTPQTIAYMLQLNYWLKKFDVRIEI